MLNGRQIARMAFILTRNTFKQLVERRLGSYVHGIRGLHTMTRVNMFVCLRNAYALREIEHLARRCAWNRIYNDLDFEALDWGEFRISGFGGFEQALAAKRGALVCTQHVGPYRRIFYEFVRRGYTVNIVLDQKVAAGITERIASKLRRQGLDVDQLDQHFRVINAEQNGSARQILKALRRNEIVLIYPDGNTGAGGQALTHQHGVAVNFFGRQIGVRRGVCHLAHVSGAPIVPAFARWEPGCRPVLDLLPAIDPDPSEDIDEFCQSGMQRLYDLFEQHVTTYPDQFEEWFHVHRWLIGNGSGEAALKFDDAYQELQGEASASTTQYYIDPARVLVVGPANQSVLVDGARGRIVKGLPVTKHLIRELSSALTVKQVLARLKPRYSVEQILKEMVRLKHFELISERPVQLARRNG